MQMYLVTRDVIMGHLREAKNTAPKFKGEKNNTYSALQSSYSAITHTVLMKTHTVWGCVGEEDSECFNGYFYKWD